MVKAIHYHFRNALVVTLIGHFETGENRQCLGCILISCQSAQQLVQIARREKRAALIIKDISWLWRTAYNCANQGCAEWDDAEKKVPVLFDLAGQVR